MFKQIFWDCDGTLVDTEPAFFESTKEALASVGFELTIDWWKNVHLATGSSAFELLRKQGIGTEQIQQLREYRNQMYRKLLPQEAVVMDGIQVVLNSLQSIPMSVVTSSHRVNNEQVMNAHNLKKYFDFIITREDFIGDKPLPDCYLQAWERASVKKEYCLVIEDTERGVRSAKAAGLTCFAIPNEYTANHDFSMADKVLSHPDELMQYFL